MPCPPRRVVAFTLVELMLSIALVLILLVGVNTVFRTTADAVDAGQFTGDTVRDQRAFGTVLANDFANAVKDPPFFIINCRQVSQYLNLTDYQTAVQVDPTFKGNPALALDLNNNGVAGEAAASSPGERISPAMVNFRSHDASTISFVARGLYRRRTADAAGTSSDGYSSPSNTTAGDAYIWIGHLAQPGHALNANSNLPSNPYYYGPEHQFLTAGVESADSGLFSHDGSFASDWVLGRQVILLRDTKELQTLLVPVENAYQRFIKLGTTSFQAAPPPWDYGGSNAAQAAEAINLSPLAYNSNNVANGAFAASNDPTASQSLYTQQSALDYAATTIEQFRSYVSEAYRTQVAQAAAGSADLVTWWAPLVYAAVPDTRAKATPLIQYKSKDAFSPDSYRFNFNATLAARAANAANANFALGRTAAQSAPYLLAHASQFVVEYAGDYLQQNTATGALTGIGQDGQVDFYVDNSSGTAIRKIRWYGLPRDENGDGVVRSYSAAPSADTAQSINWVSGADKGYADVIPLRDYITLATALGLPIDSTITNGHAPFEVECSFAVPAFDNTGAAVAANGNYADPASRYGFLSAASNTPVAPRYVCAWRNDTPAMVRILVKIDDPANRIADGPWFSYVFKLK